MTSLDEYCNLDLLRSEKRSFVGYLRDLVSRLDPEWGVENDEAAELLKIESPDLFLDKLICPKFFIQLIQVIKTDYWQPKFVKPTENGMMTAAVSIGSAAGMRIPSGTNAPTTIHARLKWAWQLIRLDLQQETSLKRHPDLNALFERMGVSLESRAKLDYRKLLLMWVAYQLKARNMAPTDFKTSFRDGRLYVLLLAEIIPVGIGVEVDVEALLKMSAEERAEKIVEVATMLGLGAFISASDILLGYDRVNLVFVAQLLRCFPSIDTFTVLITRGIQNDYCGVGFRSPVHVGTDEAFRLFGTRETSAPSPLEALVRWARLQPDSSFALIHIRDIHHKNSADSSEHLLKFGEHCISGTKGALLVSNLLPDDQLLAPNEHLITSSKSISDTVDTGFEQLLTAIKEKARGFSIRVGVIGVSTDFQIYNLLFELQTRFGIKNLATCSALTAARTRRLHFNGLDSIERLLDVTLFHSIADFTFWLAPNKTTEHLACHTDQFSPEHEICSFKPISAVPSHMLEADLLASQRSSPYITRFASTGAAVSTPLSGARTAAILEKIEFDEKNLLSKEDLFVIDNLFRATSRIVVVRKLAGGFSGAMVLLAKSFDFEGHEQGPFVLKLGPIDAIAQERSNFERIEEIIGNQAPYVYASHEGLKRAGLKFAFASHYGQPGSTTTFKQVYSDPKVSQEVIETILERVTSALNRFYTVARMRPWDFLDSYDFDGRGWALAAGGTDEPSALALRISGLSMLEPAEVMRVDRLSFGSRDGITYDYYNVWKLMNDLTGLRRWCERQNFLISFVHGDLNFSNILIDGPLNVWLIDFQYTTKAHYLKDLAKLENDAQMEVPLSSHEEFDHALSITAALHAHSPYEDTSALQAHLEKLMKTMPKKLHRVCRTVLSIRRIIQEVNMGRETDTRAYHITMLRYALHSMCFHKLPSWNRHWALAAACSHAQHIVEKLNCDLYNDCGSEDSGDDATRSIVTSATPPHVLRNSRADLAYQPPTSEDM